jgi:hypothetical protein
MAHYLLGFLLNSWTRREMETAGIATRTPAAWGGFPTVTGTVLETRSIGVPPGFDDCLAVAVNNDGTVVGFRSLIGPFTNWKYDVATDTLETFDFPSRVKDLNLELGRQQRPRRPQWQGHRGRSGSRHRRPELGTVHLR